jgi:F0F1-type ATP synthase membrane subunit a
MKVDRTNCFICRFFRSFAFSGGGALIGGFSALFLGFNKMDAIIAAFIGAMLAVLYMSKKTNKK